MDEYYAAEVGSTALGVAMARALEHAKSGRLVTDPLAGRFLAAAGITVPDPARVPPDSGVNYVAVRTRYFDDYFRAAMAAGIRQVAILAAGLDVRAQRLGWPDGTVLFEVDQPRMHEFKQRVLDSAGAHARCARHAVDADLRGDWAAELVAAGFDRDMPTAWLLEGLVQYLPAAAEEELAETVHALSAPGSMLSVEYVHGWEFEEMRDDPLFHEAAERYGVDMIDLWNIEPRRDLAKWLDTVGWTVSTEEATEVSARFGRPLVSGMDAIMGRSLLFSARREG
ncbi:SAM-dependent methyltransferase [Amycolatopsis sp. NPDC059657]|uniref:SAM-dependent methyltransferase n=1 Tax=Amycolatopsis sp. NPDC059657 TaxID=3346899 RepID=UPI00366CD2A2